MIADTLKRPQKRVGYISHENLGMQSTNSQGHKKISLNGHQNDSVCIVFCGPDQLLFLSSVPKRMAAGKKSPRLKPTLKSKIKRNTKKAMKKL